MNICPHVIRDIEDWASKKASTCFSPISSRKSKKDNNFENNEIENKRNSNTANPE